jgi:transcriptional regulator with XRE-family HTH domain
MGGVAARIREQRERLGLDLDEAARRAGLSWNEYHDLEAYDDEFAEVLSLREAKRVAAVLCLSVPAIIGSGSAAGPSTDQRLSQAPRSEFIRERRSLLGLSEEELGDRVGFHSKAIQDVESTPDGIESYPIFFVETLANALGIPWVALI